MSLFGSIAEGLGDIATFGTNELVGNPIGSLGNTAGSIISGNNSALIPGLVGGGLALGTGNPMFAGLGMGVSSALAQASAQTNQNAANAAQAAAQMSFSAQQAQNQMDFQTAAATTAYDRSQQSAQTSFDDSQASVLQQEQFQENMSNTAYQRATADMTAAGINPMLAYMQGGASTPSGGSATMPQASVSTPSGASGSAAGYTPGVVPPFASTATSSAMGLISAVTNLENTRANTTNALANAARTGVDTSNLQLKQPQLTFDSKIYNWLNDTADNVLSSAKQAWNNVSTAGMGSPQATVNSPGLNILQDPELSY